MTELDNYQNDRSVCKSARYYRKLKNSHDMPNLCLVCNESFVSFAALSQHIIGKHSKLECFECNHCGKKGKQKNNVKTYCTRRHPNVSFEIVKINENETEAFIQKNSFKGTLEEYKSKKKEKKIIKRVIRSNSNSPRETEYENDDALSECSTDTSFSEQENISDEIVSFSLSELSKEITNDCNIEIKIPKELKSTIRSLLVSKIRISIEEIKVLNSICQ